MIYTINNSIINSQHNTQQQHQQKIITIKNALEIKQFLFLLIL